MTYFNPLYQNVIYLMYCHIRLVTSDEHNGVNISIVLFGCKISCPTEIINFRDGEY